MSSVWNYFEVYSEDQSKAVCCLCYSLLSRGGTNTKSYGTSTLLRHLRFKHADEFKENVEKRKLDDPIPGTSQERYMKSEGIPEGEATIENEYDDKNELFYNSESFNLSSTHIVDSVAEVLPTKKKRLDQLPEISEDTKRSNYNKKINESDEFTVFGEHVAHRLKKILDPRRRLIVEQKISNLLFSAIMENYESTETKKVDNNDDLLSTNSESDKNHVVTN